MDRQAEYFPSKTLSRFHHSDAFYRGLRGPRGAGKSTACCAEILMRGVEQDMGPDGARKTRFAAIRNTYRELEDTTLKTWLDWTGGQGRFNRQHMSDTIETVDENNNPIEIEVLFRSLDKPADVKKVLSLELTGAWVNEAREIPKGIIDALGDCVGRYPAVKDGGCTWRGVIMDTNSPDDDHWWYRLAEEERPKGWDFFTQPGGLIEREGEFFENPEAENLDNLEPGYYLTRAGGKNKDHIRVYYCNQYGFVRDGKPIYPEYNDAIHCTKEIIEPIKGRTLYVGIDFGLTPAAVFAQQTVTGRWHWIDELVTEDMGATRFAEVLGPKLRGEYRDYDLEVFGDPAGDDRAQTDETTPIQILRAAGIQCRPAPSNDPVLRREAVAVPLSRLVDGKPGLLISPRCKVTRKGMAGGYCYRRLQVAGAERYENKPDKNRYSHPCEAGQYAMLGAGEGRKLVRPPNRGEAQKFADSDYAIFG